VAGFAASLGCRMMMVGVESYDQNCLNAVSRNIEPGDTVTAFKSLRKFGIRSAAQVIVGLHDANAPASEKRVKYHSRLKDFLKDIKPDYVSLNIYQPRPGVPTGNRILARLASDTARHLALADRINKDFYFRPGVFFKQLTTVKSLPQLALQAKIAAGLFLNRS
jgi:radical SAM superfamily enzyme YgiQ (UPF0313 family)